MIPGSGRFRRSDRLLRSRDFQRVGRHGKRSASKDFVILVAEPAPSPSSRLQSTRTNPVARGSRRLGATVSRKVGNAVVRNRIKRAVREWFRTRCSELPEDVDIVVIAKPRASELVGSDIAQRLDAMMGLVDRLSERVQAEGR